MGERVSDIEKLRIQKTSDCNTGWRQEDDKIIKSLAKSLTKKKWDIIKLCLETIQDISITVKEMKTTELKKMSIDWSEDDARKVEMIRIKNIRYLSLRSSKLKTGPKENILMNFCETKGYKKEKEDWRKKVDKEIELKETIMKDLLVKKKLAKSKKKRLELLMECKRTLQELIVDWKETPILDEERMTRIIKESWMKEKNRSSHTQSSDSKSQIKTLRTAKTTKGSPVRQLKPKKALDIIPARVSRQIDEKLITKPQQIYRSMEISDQTSPSTDTN